MDKPSSSASGFWTAVHFPQPLYSFRFPAALGITSHGVQPDVKRLKCGGWELRAPAVRLFSPGLYAGERKMGGPKGWDPGGRELRCVPWCWAERAFGRATHGSSTSSANGFHAARDSRELRSARPTASGAPWPGSTSPFTSPHLSQQFRLASAG